MNHKLILALACLLILRCSTIAQMQDPPKWLNYEKELGVKNNLRTYDFDVAIIASTNHTNVLWPSEQPDYSIQIINNTEKQLAVSGKIDIIQTGTKGIPNDVWQPEIYKIKDIGAIPI